MAKKEKKENEVKSVKEKLKDSKKNKEKENSLSKIFNCVKCLFISSAVVAAIISIVAYLVYATFTYVPAMPKIDLNEYWGPEGTNIKDTEIRPFRIVFTESLQEEIRTLFEMNRRQLQGFETPSFPDSGWGYGVNSSDFSNFMADGIFDYTFRERAKFLNKYDHFKTKVQGLDIHFMRVKPDLQNKNLKVYPLLLLHGWPGSIREFYETIPRLTSEKKGYNFVFEVIVPSLPGFLYSEGAKRPGMSPVEIAVIMRNLMHRIGHTKYYVQGGDFGHAIGTHMATIFPNEVLGYHTNFPVNFSKYSYWLWLLGSINPKWVAEGVEDGMYPIKDKALYYMEESGYLHLQSTKPDTIGIALQDSPIGLAAYMIDRFMILTDPKNKIRERGGFDRYFDMQKLMDNIMMYWSTGSITTSMRLYKESWRNKDLQQTLAQIPTPVPTWVLRFKFELIQHSDYLLRWKYPNLVGSSRTDAGGHFAAFERPKTFADDVFRAVSAFLTFHSQNK